MAAESNRLGAQTAAFHGSRGGARSVALDVLQDVGQRGAFADEALSRAFGCTSLDPRDRALAQELVYGVLRHQATLDWRLEQLTDRPLARLPLPVRIALRLGAYQLLYLERIPASAAVNESVALAKAQSGKDWAGYVNAVLRSLLRKPAPPWPDPEQDPVSAYVVRYSCPRWLVERWLARYGREGCEVLCRATVEIPPLTIRVNTLRLTREELQRELQAFGIEARPTPISPSGLILEKSGPVADLPLFKEGAFYIEDEAAQLIPPILDPQPGERVLDACAAPGGKATHLAALMRNHGEIVALDRSLPRLRLLEENCRRLGVRIVKALPADVSQDLTALPREGALASVLDRPFDRILLDAPCSGLGVLRRHPEGKWRKCEDQLPRQQALQIRLLTQVSRLLRPGGTLVYSTCSTEPEENEQVIERFCDEHPGFARESVAPWLPPTGRHLLNALGDFSTMSPPHVRHRMDGFFAARLRKADRS